VPLSLAELAHEPERSSGGTAPVIVSRVATLESAEPDAIAFLANPKYRPLLASTRASAVIVAPEMAGDTALPALVDPNPYAIFAKVAALLHPRTTLAAGVHPVRDRRPDREDCPHGGDRGHRGHRRRCRHR
jgi:UDP-3-O-[3-hydroxymyristoyl] glucosamine N-acyltransferase